MSEIQNLFALVDEIKALQDSIAELESTIANKDETIASLEIQIMQLESYLAEAQTEITTLENELTGANTKIGDLEADLETLEGELADAQNQIIQLEAELDEAQLQINQLESDLAAAQTQIDDLEVELVAAYDRIAELEAQLEDGDTTEPEPEPEPEPIEVSGFRNGLFAFYDGTIINDDLDNVAARDGGSLSVRNNGAGITETEVGLELDGSAAFGGDHPNIRMRSGDRYFGFDLLPTDNGSIIDIWDNHHTGQEYILDYYNEAFRLRIRTDDSFDTISVPATINERHLVEVSYSNGYYELTVDRSETATSDVGPHTYQSLWRPMRVLDGFVGTFHSAAIHYRIPSEEERDFYYNNGQGRAIDELDGPIIPTLYPEAQIMYQYLAESNLENLVLPTEPISVTAPSDPDEIAKGYMQSVDGQPQKVPSGRNPAIYTLGHMEQHCDPKNVLVPDYAQLGSYTYGMRPSTLPKYEFEGLSNPYATNEGLARRAAAKVFPYAMVVDYGRDAMIYHSARTLHFLSGYLEQLGEYFYHYESILPTDVRNAIIGMAQRWIRIMARRGPQDVNSNMDAKAMEGASWFVAGNAGIDDDVERLLRKYIFGSQDGTIETFDHDNATWHPSGIPLEADGPSVDYGARWVDHAVKTKLNLGPDSRWDFLDEVLLRTTNLIAHWVFFDVDGQVMGDAASGNRVAGLWLVDVQRQDKQSRHGTAVLYGHPEYDYVGTRIGIRRYKSSNNEIDWADQNNQIQTIQSIDGYTVSDDETSTYEGDVLRTGSPWPQSTGVGPKGYTGFADDVNEVAQAADERSFPYTHPDSPTPDKIVLFSKENPAFRFRKGTASNGRRFGYMLEHFSAFGNANVPQYGNRGGGKVATFSIDDMGPILVNERYFHTEGWWDADRNDWPLEDFVITYADGGQHAFSLGRDVQSNAEVTVRSDGIDYAYNFKDDANRRVEKSFTDMDDGVAGSVALFQIGDDITEAVYKLPLVDKGLTVEANGIEVGTEYVTTDAVVVTRNGQQATIEFDREVPVRLAATTRHNKTRTPVRPLIIQLQGAGTLTENTLTYKVRA